RAALVAPHHRQGATAATGLLAESSVAGLAACSALESSFWQAAKRTSAMLALNSHLVMLANIPVDLHPLEKGAHTGTFPLTSRMVIIEIAKSWLTGNYFSVMRQVMASQTLPC
ncbi:MAG: hypothetical protein ACK2T5_04355, partial [Anaerolineales bacterium]